MRNKKFILNSLQLSWQDFSKSVLDFSSMSNLFESGSTAESEKYNENIILMKGKHE